MQKINVSFDPTSIWDRKEFRNFISELKYVKPAGCPDFEYNVIIITNNPDTDFIDKVAAQAGVDTVYILPTYPDKIDTIDLQSNIHLDGQISIIQDVDDKIWPILVNNTIDYFKIGYKYITNFDFAVKQVIKELSGEEGDKTSPC